MVDLLGSMAGVCVCPFSKTHLRPSLLDGEEEESRFALRHLLGRCKIYEPFYQKSFMTERFQAKPQDPGGELATVHL